jgi:dihydroorotase
MDTQVHFREPGNTHKEDLASGSLARSWAASPLCSNAQHRAAHHHPRRHRGQAGARQGPMHCDHAFYVGATPANIGALGELEKMPGVCGIKAFLGSSTGTLLLNKEADILAALKAGKRRSRSIPKTKTA